MEESGQIEAQAVLPSGKKKDTNSMGEWVGPNTNFYTNVDFLEELRESAKYLFQYIRHPGWDSKLVHSV